MRLILKQFFNAEMNKADIMADVVGDMMYYARIQVISQAMLGSEGRRPDSKN